MVDSSVNEQKLGRPHNLPTNSFLVDYLKPGYAWYYRWVAQNRPLEVPDEIVDYIQDFAKHHDWKYLIDIYETLNHFEYNQEIPPLTDYLRPGYIWYYSWVNQGKPLKVPDKVVDYIQDFAK